MSSSLQEQGSEATWVRQSVAYVVGHDGQMDRPLIVRNSAYSSSFCLRRKRTSAPDQIWRLAGEVQMITWSGLPAGGTDPVDPAERCGVARPRRTGSDYAPNSQLQRSPPIQPGRLRPSNNVSRIGPSRDSVGGCRAGLPRHKRQVNLDSPTTTRHPRRHYVNS